MNQLTYAVVVFYILSAMGYILFLIRQTPHWDRSGWVLMVTGLLLHTFIVKWLMLFTMKK